MIYAVILCLQGMAAQEAPPALACQYASSAGPEAGLTQKQCIAKAEWFNTHVADVGPGKTMKAQCAELNVPQWQSVR